MDRHIESCNPRDFSQVLRKGGFDRADERRQIMNANDPMSEHASTGTYYFKKGSYIKKYFDMAIAKDIHHKGEYYVTLVYNLLVQDGLRVGYYDTPFATVMGTPEEVENFESWVNILTKGQIKCEEDLLNCYRYWKKYHASDLCRH